MADIKISDMMRMQVNLWEQHKDTWSPMEAKFGRNFILWMMEEMGECTVSYTHLDVYKRQRQARKSSGSL